MGVVVCLFGCNTFGLWGWWYGHWVVIPIPCRVIVVLSFGGNTCNLCERSLFCVKARAYFFKDKFKFQGDYDWLIDFSLFSL